MMTANGAADNDDDEDDRRTDDNAVPQLAAAVTVTATVRLVRPRIRPPVVLGRPFSFRFAWSARAIRSPMLGRRPSDNRTNFTRA